MSIDERLFFELSDYIRIKRIIEKFASQAKLNKPHFSQFLSTLDNAEIVPDGKLPEDIVKINSQIKYKYTGEEKLHEAIIVFPADVPEDPRNLSILTPMGLALIGQRVNTSSEYYAPGGIYGIEVKEVINEKQHVSV